MTGGLAAALLPRVEYSGATWVGCSTGRARNANQRGPFSEVEALGEGTLATVDIPAEHYSGFYEGFSNSALWPALHSRVNLIDVSDIDYVCYRNVNAVMGQALLSLRSEETAFWVQDYHFLPLGAQLRQSGIDQPIGLFLHTPWPVPAVIQHVPHHREVIKAMLAYDLIGFQTEEHCRNFLSYVGANLGVATENGLVISRHRPTRCQVFPIGIDVDKFAELAARSGSRPWVSWLRRSFKVETLAIGVDRLDYTKGLDNRIRAFDCLWSKQPDLARKVSLLQIATPSRSGIKAYRNLQGYLARRVREVNNRHGDVDWTPIRYLETGFSQTVLAALYRTAKVAVVTPMRDGMNLVAKEFVAAQDPTDPGVLVLSKFAGAANELDGALVVDPDDIGGMVNAISSAISMPLDQRRSRWQAMMEKLQGYTIQQWFSDFVAELEKSRAVEVAGEFIPQDVGAPSSSKRRKVEDDSAGPSSHLDLPRQLSYPAADVPAWAPANDFGHAVPLGWDHGPQTAPDVLIGVLTRSGDLPTPFQPMTNLYIRGQPYAAVLRAGIREPTPNNPLGVNVILIPRLRGG